MHSRARRTVSLPPAPFRAGNNEKCFSVDGANRPCHDSIDNRDRDSNNRPGHDIYNTQPGLMS